MKMINNYLNSFENYLPEDSKDEVRAELESLIYEELEDMQESLGRDLSQQEQESYLLKLGHPMRVASGYLPNQELINKDYFPAYKKALEVSLIIFSIIVLLTSIRLNFEDLSIIGFVFDVFWRVLEASLDVFVVVTLIFYLLQKSNYDLSKLYSWSPKDLTSSGKKVPLSRFNRFFEMMFEGLFLVFWNHLFFSEQILIESSFMGNEIMQNISISAEWQSVHWIINFLVGASLLLNAYHFLKGHKNTWSTWVNISNNLVSIVVLAFIASFEQYLVIESSELANFNWQKIVEYSNINILIILGVIALVALWDIYADVKRLKGN
ncbi:MAG: hypothetical protein COA86_18170 [Kangiella sp.]|nr:MAG: hypothetical protein COA86_18170 [Kangiella sp.]